MRGRSRKISKQAKAPAMTPKQWRALIARLDLSQVRAAELFGYGPRTGQRWASENPDDHLDIPVTVVWLARAMAAAGVKRPEELLKWIEERRQP
jgi:hypothetical protein